MTYQTRGKISIAALEILIGTLNVEFLTLKEFQLEAGRPLTIPIGDGTQFYYGQSGTVAIALQGGLSMELGENVIAIIPPCVQPIIHGSLDRLQAGTRLSSSLHNSDVSARVICGSFKVSCGHAIDLFTTLAESVIERFDPDDEINVMLTSAVAELASSHVGATTAAGALMTHVLVKVLRRSLTSTYAWTKRLAILADPHITIALSDMVARPGGPHSVISLARRAAMSRTAFMLRFSQVFGISPMVLLREIRMRRAATYLTLDSRSIDEIARSVGYTSRSSFVRAFRSVHGMTPSEYRAGARSANSAGCRRSVTKRLVA